MVGLVNKYKLSLYGENFWLVDVYCTELTIYFNYFGSIFNLVGTTKSAPPTNALTVNNESKVSSIRVSHKLG